MKHLVEQLYYFFLHLDGIGLLLLGILDSSFLFMPLGNDLLMIGLVASDPGRLPFFVTMAAFGSVIGCGLVDLIARKGGEEGLSRFVPKRRLERVNQKVQKNAGWALLFAAVMPPPFPFTPVVAAASAFQFPRYRFFVIIFAARYLRFTAIGLLALSFGKRIQHWAELPIVQTVVLAVVVIAIIGSVASVWKWIAQARRKPSPATA